MPFLIETFDKPDSHTLRKQFATAHLDFLDKHQHLLLACGDKRSDDGKRALGGIYLLNVDTRQDAAAFIANDPFSIADLFEKVTILRWEQAYLAGRALMLRRRFGLRRRLTESSSNP